MKRTISLILALLMFCSLSCLTVHAGSPKSEDKIGIYYSVTWIMEPERSYPLKGIVHYVATYVKTGDVPVPPSATPAYETDDFFYVFVGWKRLENTDEINRYYDEKPGLDVNENYTQKPFDPIVDKDQVYAPVFRKYAKKFAFTDDRLITIDDVSALLDVLSGKIPEKPSVGQQIILESDGNLSIRHVTEMLNYLRDGNRIL